MTDRMALLMVVEQLRRPASGGIGTYVHGLLQGLGSLGPDERPDIELLASRPSGGRHGPDPLAGLGYPLHSSRLPGPLLTRGWDHGVLRAPPGFDVVHAVSLATLEPGRAALVVTVHDLLWRRVPTAYPTRGRLWHEAALRRALARAQAFIVPADVVADDLCRAGARRDAVTVIPMGSDHLPPPDRAAAGALLARLGIVGPFLLSVGTLEPRKNLETLVEAWRVVRRGLAVDLVLAGRRRADGPLFAPEPGLRLAGEVPDSELARLYTGAVALGYPSHYEGFGLPVVEAMQCGAPVIASRAVTEAAGDAAVYADTPQELARAMSEAVARPEWRAEMGARSLERAREFSWERTASLTHEVYEEARRRFGH